MVKHVRQLVVHLVVLASALVFSYAFFVTSSLFDGAVATTIQKSPASVWWEAQKKMQKYATAAVHGLVHVCQNPPLVEPKTKRESRTEQRWNEILLF